MPRTALTFEELRQRQKAGPGYADGAVLRERRQRTGLKLPAFAAEVGLAEGTYRNIELMRFRTTPEALHRIANRLGCELSEILPADEAA